ncbi:MAG: hypothetical protein AAFQ21_13335 [Pseudomonadota bacterium]
MGRASGLRVGVVSSLRAKRSTAGVGAEVVHVLRRQADGIQPAFRCSEIRRKGPCRHSGNAVASPFAINAAFLDAERVYREALNSATLADINAQSASDMGPDLARESLQWLCSEANDVTP